ncbi:MAG: hypothetical protein QM656_13460 [Paracoccaceae bacterium]
MKTILATLALTLLPGLAAAECMGVKHDTSAASCAPGSVWDGAAGKCVKTNS